MRTSPLSLAIAIAIYSSTSPVAAAADEASGASMDIDSKVTPLEKVEVRANDRDFRADASSIGGKVPTSLRDIPQSVTVINRSLFEAQGATSFQAY